MIQVKQKKYNAPNLVIEKLHRLLCFLSYYFAVGFGIGFFRYMPGTVSTFFIGIPTYLLISYLKSTNYISIVFLGILLGIYICNLAKNIINKPDPSAIVWDEICGYWCTMIGVPRETLWIILGFFAFRVFDIWKPWPINIVQRNIHGGFGIMLDDILAAIYGSCVIQLLIYLRY